MAKCPSCGDMNAYEGSYGWSCVIRRCRNFDFSSNVNHIEPLNGNSKEAVVYPNDVNINVETSHKYDGGQNPFKHWAHKLDDISFDIKCDACNLRLGDHRGNDGKCPPKNGSYNFSLTDTYFKYPRGPQFLGFK